MVWPFVWLSTTTNWSEASFTPSACVYRPLKRISVAHLTGDQNWSILQKLAVCAIYYLPELGVSNTKKLLLRVIDENRYRNESRLKRIDLIDCGQKWCSFSLLVSLEFNNSEIKHWRSWDETRDTESPPNINPWRRVWGSHSSGVARGLLQRAQLPQNFLEVYRMHF